MDSYPPNDVRADICQETLALRLESLASSGLSSPTYIEHEEPDVSNIVADYNGYLARRPSPREASQSEVISRLFSDDGVGNLLMAWLRHLPKGTQENAESCVRDFLSAHLRPRDEYRQHVLECVYHRTWPQHAQLAWTYLSSGRCECNVGVACSRSSLHAMLRSMKEKSPDTISSILTGVLGQPHGLMQLYASPSSLDSVEELLSQILESCQSEAENGFHSQMAAFHHLLIQRRNNLNRMARLVADRGEDIYNIMAWCEFERTPQRNPGTLQALWTDMAQLLLPWIEVVAHAMEDITLLRDFSDETLVPCGGLFNRCNNTPSIEESQRS